MSNADKSNEDKKQEIADRVSVSLAHRVDKMTTKDNHQKRKTCTMCKKGYLGAADSSTCGDACRKKKSRG